MINPFTRSIFLKLLGKAALVLAGCALLFWYTLNLWVERKLPFIETAISVAANHPVTLESAHYNIFKGFLLSGVEVRQNKEDALPVRIGRVRIEPQFQLLPEPGIGVRKIVFEKPDIAVRLDPDDPFHLRLFLNNLAPEIGKIGSMTIRMNLSSVEVTDGKVLVLMSNDKKDPGRNFSGINFSIQWKKQGTKITDIRVKSGSVRMLGHGESDLTGTEGHYRFLLSSPRIPVENLRELFAPFVPDAGYVQLYVSMDGDGKHFEPALQAVFYSCSLHDEARKISLTNMDGVARLSKNGLELKRFWFELNKLPLFLDSKLQMNESARLFLKMHTYRGGVPADKFIRASLKATAVHFKRGWSGAIRLNGAEDQWTLSFRGLSRDGRGLWVSRHLQLRRQDRSRKELAQTYLFQGLAAEISSNERYLSARILKASLNSVDMTANLWLRTKDLAWGATANIKDADVSKLLRYIQSRYPISGRTDVNLSWKGIGGAVQCLIRYKISEGMIGPSAQLSDWAKQTGIDALSNARFHEITGEAAYEKGCWYLRGFHLAGDALIIRANLKINTARVWGSLSMKFPSASISDSSSLKWLLRFVGAGEWADFDFKVAGNPASPRVEWLGGEFKKKVESRLAPWMKYQLAKQVEKYLGESVV